MLRLLVLAVSIASGGAAWFLMNSEIDRRLSEVASESTIQKPEATVLVYAIDNMRGTAASMEVFKWQNRLLEALPPDAIIKTEQNIGRLQAVSDRQALNRSVKAFEFVRWNDFGPITGNFLSQNIDKNMRAVGIKVSTDKLAGGFILPNDIVDVILTLQRDIDGDGFVNPTSMTIIKNAKVLAVGQNAIDKSIDPVSLFGAVESATNTKSSEAKTLLADTITLQLTPEQSEILVAATQSGKIDLVLKREDDASETVLGDVSLFTEKMILVNDVSSNEENVQQISNNGTVIDRDTQLEVDAGARLYVQQQPKRVNIIEGNRSSTFEFN